MNPLVKHFRQPGVHTSLPSNGRFHPVGNVDFTDTGTIPTLPLRAADEMEFKNPDALLSGEALKNMIRSCCPSIKDVNYIPAPDIAPIILAIRASSYGDTYNIDITCPACEKSYEYGLSIDHLMATMSSIPEDTSIRISDELIVNCRPLFLKEQNELMGKNVLLQQQINALVANTIISDDEKKDQLGDMVRSIQALEMESIAIMIESVISGEDIVTDYEYIKEFIDNIDSKTLDIIREKIDEINESGVDSNIHMDCECGHTWDTTFEINPTTFFE